MTFFYWCLWGEGERIRYSQPVFPYIHHRSHPLWFHKPNPHLQQRSQKLLPLFQFNEIQYPTPAFRNIPFRLPHLHVVPWAKICKTFFWKKYLDLKLVDEKNTPFNDVATNGLRKEIWCNPTKEKKARYPMSKFYIVHVRNLGEISPLYDELLAKIMQEVVTDRGLRYNAVFYTYSKKT